MTQTPPDVARLRLLDDLLHEFVAEEVARQLAERDAAHDPAVSPWLSLAEGADYLRISERTLERRIAKGRVRSTVIGRRRLLHRDDLDALAEAATGEDVAPTTSPRRRME